MVQLWKIRLFLSIFLRRMDLYKPAEYNSIKGFKNKYAGGRCFIVCTGPSLTLDDLDKLKSEVCLSMNTIVKIFGETEWRPTYYGVTDDAAYAELEPYIYRAIESSDLPHVLLSDDNICKPFKVPESPHIYPFHCIYSSKRHNLKFSDNAYATVYGGYTITYVLIQIAVYMGFKEIYLLGCDCDYSGEKTRFAAYESKEAERHFKGEAAMVEAYKRAKEYADSRGIKIYNATRGGKLEVFERVDLNDVARARKNTGVKEKEYGYADV